MDREELPPPRVSPRIPCSSQDQAGNPWAYALKTTIDGKHPSWAICDKPTTVAVIL
jgi:hypothetical protein